jgi:long-chain fatty acid transport protein
MLIDHDGDRTIVSGGVPTTYSAHSEVRYPASLGIGLALTSVKNLTIALDVNWYGWSSMDKVTVKTDVLPDSVTPLDAKDSRDIRIGAEYSLPQGWLVRAGYAYAEGAFPATNIVPAQPDADGYDMSLGAGRTMGDWRIDVAYLYSVTHEVATSANIFNYNGKYNISQKTLGLTAVYRF